VASTAGCSDNGNSVSIDSRLSVGTFDSKATAESVTQEMNLNGKTALVTECNSGLGYETMRVSLYVSIVVAWKSVSFISIHRPIISAFLCLFGNTLLGTLGDTTMSIWKHIHFTIRLLPRTSDGYLPKRFW